MADDKAGLVIRERKKARYLQALPAEAVPDRAAPAIQTDAFVASLSCAFSAPEAGLDPALAPSQFVRPKADVAILARQPNVSDAALHDAYFAVVRSTDDAQGVLLEGIVAAADVL